MAYSEDGQPYATRSDTPDQQGAGVVNPPTMTMPSLLEALNMGGAAPAPPPGMPPPPPGGLGGGGMGSLLGMLPPPVSQASVYAQALSGGISAMRGTPDPVQAIVQNQQQQQNAISSMLMKMSEMQRQGMQWGITNQRLQREEDRREAKDQFEMLDKLGARKRQDMEFQLKALDGQMAGATDPDVRLMIAQKRAKVEENALGTPVPQNVIEGWALPSPATEERDKQIKQAFAVAGGDPEKQQLVAQQFRLDPQSVKYYTGITANPALIGLKTVQDLRAQDVKDQVAEEQLFDLRAKRAWPEMAGDPKFAMAMRAMSQQLYPGQKYTELSESEKTAVFNGVHQQAKAEEEYKIRLQADVQTQKLLAGINASADARAAAQAAKPTPITAMQRYMQPYEQGATFLNSIAKLRADLKGIPDDALPESDSKLAQLWASQKRGWLYTNNESLKNFVQNWGPITIGFDRNYFDDKGQKSVRVFDEQLKVVDNLPPRKTIEAYLTRMEGLLKDRMGQHLETDSIPGAGTPPDVLARAKFITAPYIKQTPATPLEPLKIEKTGRFMDMRKGSATYGKTIEATYNIGDAIPDGLIEVK